MSNGSTRTYTIPVGTPVQVRRLTDGADQWVPHVTTTSARHDTYYPTTDGRYWVFIRDGWAARVEPHRVGRNGNPPPCAAWTPKKVKVGQAKHAKTLAASPADLLKKQERAEARVEARKVKRERERQRVLQRVAAGRASRAAEAARAARVEAETRERIEKQRAARAAELAANDAEWARLIKANGEAVF